MNNENNKLELKLKTKLVIDYLELIITNEIIKNSFIRDLEIRGFSKEFVTISLNSKKALEIVNKNYRELFKMAIVDIFKERKKIRFVVGDEINVDKIINKRTSRGVNSKYTFYNYFESHFNKEVIFFAKKVINNLNKYSPLFIHSSSGLGKTHLMHAIGNSLIEKNKVVCYVEPNAFTNRITSMFRDKKNSSIHIQSFVDEIDEADVVFFDDIQYLSDRPQILKIFFTIINNFLEKEKQVIFSSDKTPTELIGFHERFKTRFASGVICRINKPNLDELVEVLKFKLEKKHMSPGKWERQALKFIVRNYSSSIRSIEGAIKRVSIYADETDSNIEYTYNVVSKMFEELLISKEDIDYVRIVEKVSNFYKISKKDILGKSRKKDVVLARQISIWLIREILSFSYNHIGMIFGGKDHSTIISSIKKINEKMGINKTIKTAINLIKENINSMK